MKEYPSGLSAAMADCVEEWLYKEIPRFDPGDGSSLRGKPMRTLELVEPFRIDFSELHTFGADTRGALTQHNVGKNDKNIKSPRFEAWHKDLKK